MGAPKNWEKRRKAISNRIMSLSREPKKTEANNTSGPVVLDNQYIRKKEEGPNVMPVKRLEVSERLKDIPAVLKYNILRREDNAKIQQWKSYPGIEKIINLARDVLNKADMSNIEQLAGLLQIHESQQSATIAATIAVLVGDSLDDSTEKTSREAIGDD